MYIKFLKDKSIQNEQFRQNFKHFREKLRKKPKQTCYQFLLKEGQNDMKHKKQIMTEITGKSRLNSNRFLKSIKVDGKAIKTNSHIAEEFYNTLPM